MNTPTIIFLLIIAALVLIFFEFLTVSFGIFTTLALVALVSAVYYAFTISATVGFSVLVLALVAVPTYLVVLVRWLPKTSLGKGLFLKRAPSGAAGGTPDATGLSELIGKEGVVETVLRPGGKIVLAGRRIDAQAESGVIEKGERVRVVGIHMGNAIVRGIKQ